MRRQVPRSAWLALFAGLNLVVWATVAVAVVVLASDVVDLGIEATLRQAQATVVSSLSTGFSEVDRLSPTHPAGALAPPSLSGEVSTPPPSDPHLTGTSTALPPSLPGATPGPTLAAPPPEGPTSGAPAQAGGADVPTSRPLLLADPPFGDLSTMDAEMARSTSGRPVQIRYQEAALNREVAALYQNNPELPFRNTSLDLERSGITMTADVSVLGFQMRAFVQGQIVASDCLPRLEVESVSLAGVLVPGFLKGALGEMLQGFMQWYPADYPLCLDQIVLETDRATIYGHRR